MREHESEFCCPEYVPPGSPSDFCISGSCPEIRQQPSFPSPNSCLPKEILEEVEERIAKANELLLDLGLEERQPREIFQRGFDGLQGLDVTLLLNNETQDRVCGQVFLVGFDFVLLRTGKKEMMVPYDKIGSILAEGRYAENSDKPSLSDIDPCFRRELTFHFGRTVASSPELIQIFFRLTLRIYLLLLLNKEIEIKLDGHSLKGMLYDVDKESLTMEVADEHKVVPMEKVWIFSA